MPRQTPAQCRDYEVSCLVLYQLPRSWWLSRRAEFFTSLPPSTPGFREYSPLSGSGLFTGPLRRGARSLRTTSPARSIRRKDDRLDTSRVPGCSAAPRDAPRASDDRHRGAATRSGVARQSSGEVVYPLRTIREPLPGVTRATQPLRPGGARGKGAPLGHLGSQPKTLPSHSGGGPTVSTVPCRLTAINRGGTQRRVES